MTEEKKPEPKKKRRGAHVHGVLDSLHSSEAVVRQEVLRPNDIVSVCGGLYRVLAIHDGKATINLAGRLTHLPVKSLQKTRSCYIPPRGSKSRQA
jgi:hypothetical protein